MGWYEATYARFHRDYYRRRKLDGLLGTTTKSVRSILQFPNILLDGWEGLKAHTFEKGQSKGAHLETKISTALRAAKLLNIFPTTLCAVQHHLYTSNLLPTPMYT